MHRITSLALGAFLSVDGVVDGIGKRLQNNTNPLNSGGSREIKRLNDGEEGQTASAPNNTEYNPRAEIKDSPDQLNAE